MTRPANSKAKQGGDKPRSIPVSVRFADDQLKVVQEAAEELGLDVSSYVRMAALREARREK